MKAIMMSIKPKWVKEILNGNKTIEIRKKFPKDYVGWVYIYVTKALPHLAKTYANDYEIYDETQLDKEWLGLNGKVVARFWCDKVEEIKYHFGYYDMGEWTESYILENACLSAEELDNYLQASKEYDEKKVSRVYGYAIHITNLEIFDKPKDISEYKPHYGYPTNHRLTRAPQSWCYVEV